MGLTIGSERFEPGLALQGLFETFGLGMFVKIKVSADNGVFARGALEDKIQLGNVFMVSNVAGDGPPELQLDTANEPFLTITGKVFLLGLSQSIEASLDDSGFSLRIEENLGIAGYELDCQVNSLSDFRANGSFLFGLKADIGPIQLTSGGPSFGKIKLDTGFDGSLGLSLIDRVFSARIDGSFSFAGITLNLPTINLSVSPNSIEEIPELVKQRIIENAKDVFEDILKDAGKWLEAIGDELIELADDVTEKAKQVAHVLRDQFNESAEEVGTAIRNTLDLGSKAAAAGLESIGESSERIASVLKDLGDNIEEISSALKDLRKAPDEIGDALRAAGFSKTDIDNILSILFQIPPIHLDIHTDTPIVPAISFHTDAPLIPPVSLHGDVGHGDAHGDVGHGDEHGDVGHADEHGDIGHGDTHGDIHGDAHGDNFAFSFHTDTRTGPHTDIRAVGFHTDVAAVGFHTDVAAVGFHTDVAKVGFHTDTPEVSHVDIHTDTPEVGHGDAHGDVA